MTHAERVHLHHRRFQLTPLAVALLGAMTALSVQASESTELPVVTVTATADSASTLPAAAPGGQVVEFRPKLTQGFHPKLTRVNGAQYT